MAATAAGVVAHKSLYGVSDHPACGVKVGYAEIFLAAATPPHEEGNVPDATVDCAILPRMKRICGMFIFITLLPLIVCASPHHSFAAEYDANKPIRLKAWLYMNVKDADGKLVKWAIEMGPPNGLIRRGVHKDSVPVGPRGHG